MAAYLNFTRVAMCIKCGFIKLSVNLEGLEPEIKRIAQLIYDGKLKLNQIDGPMVKKVAEELMKGIFTGYGKTLDSKSLTEAERTFLTKIQSNVYVFSGFKNYQQLRETTLLLKDDNGNLKSFNGFLNDVKQVNHTYNEVYLNAEYGTAVASAQTAATWEDYANNGIDMLTYVTAGDDRVREEHAILEGVTYPVDDDFWDTYYPPNDWGCRCDTKPSAPGAKDVRISTSERPELPQMFRNNVGKSGVLFPDTHPYYNVNQQARKAILQQVADIIPPNRTADLHYQSGTGARVYKEASVNKNELEQNHEIAKVLADNGHNVALPGIDNTPGVKNPDALIDGKITMEFKTNFKPTKTAIDTELRKGKDQADHVLLHIKSDISPETLANAINDRVRQAENIKEVWLIINDKLIKLNRLEIKNEAHLINIIKKGG